MRKMFNKINETGTMLVEAMAMLGLIAMVTPILYKKAAERTTELQDINASNQLRILANAMDAYIKDNFSRIAAGEEVVNNCNDDNVDYGNPVDSSSDSGSGVTSQTDTYTFDVSHLCEYLPYGFLDSNGKTQDSKLFASSESDSNSFQVILKKTTASEVGGEDEDDKVIAQTITGFVTAVPHDGEEFPSTRVARIATMVGSNGGYKMANYEDEDGNVVSGKIMGAQGIWSLDGDDELDMNLAENTFVISSLQPISSQGLANEDVLHRKYEPQNDNLLNSMETDLFMSYNDKNHNIRQVNQIIMMPDTEWMVGAENNSTDMRPEENIAIPFNDDNSLSNLDYSLYIGNKGGAFLEGNLAAVSSLFTVKEENDSGDGGIKYYETKTITDSTDPNNTVTTTKKGGSVFSVTSSKLEYGNIDSETAGVLLTVDKENKSMNFAYKTNSPGEDGTTSTASKNLIAAQGSDDQNLSVNLLNGALSVRNNDVNSDTTYKDNSTKQWKSETPAVVIGGGDAYTGSYTSYEYDTNGTPKNPSDTNNSNGSGTNNSNGSGTNNSEGRHALTVNGPAFVKDSLRTPHLKTYNVDAAKLRAGVAWDSFNTATNDEDFYLIAEKSGNDNPTGWLLVGKVTPSTDTSTGDTSTQYRLQIAEEDDNDIKAGISMYHEEGISLRSGKDVSLVDEAISNGTSEDPASGQIKIGAEKAVSLSTIDGSGAFHNEGVVSIQDDMLRAYNISNGEDDYGYGYIDSVTDEMRILSRDARDQHDKLYSRGDRGLVALGDMDFSISAISESESDDKIVPVVDIEAAREEGLISSRFAGGFAIYDYDVTGEDYPDNPAFDIDEEGEITGGSIGNPSLYVGKGDFQILTTEDGPNKGDIVLHVDNNDTYDATPTTTENGTPGVKDDRGSVYIRRGAINIASANGSRLANEAIAADYNETDPVGYIAANRFISHVVPETGALDKTDTNYGKVTPYDRYEVNPAYTSVMHDIKLTTRGGARLSDILPDFINKGIYVVNNTFQESTPWQDSTATAEGIESYEITNENTAFKTATSPYLGFVPTPICPPNYSKVITVNPSGWSMAEAGTPYDDQKRIDIVPHTNPYLYWNLPDGTPRTDVENAEPVQPLTFQKSTWLRAMVVPHCEGFDLNNSCKDNPDNFTGWGVIMGFLYPESYYGDFLGEVGKGDNIKGVAFGSGNVDEGSDTVYWNIYPVYYRQLEGYATVYCYFNREDFNVDMVDTTYDQLNSPRKYWEKNNTDYINRLNDSTLKYNDPW